ncbi:MAG: glycine zipper domain-containing protein [Candidatus Omnitrophica bacterium]|nr:glycine zipper domain-containing protein [Candidatus Omnitrophota bacterium]
MKKLLVVSVFAAMVLTGCLTTTQQGAGAGAVVGGGLGAIIGHQSGSTAEGAAIGAGVGALSGALIGHQVDKTKFCPVCGRKFKSDVEYCPYDGEVLRTRQ